MLSLFCRRPFLTGTGTGVICYGILGLLKCILVIILRLHTPETTFVTEAYQSLFASVMSISDGKLLSVGDTLSSVVT